jgi:hypothetical protein
MRGRRNTDAQNAPVHSPALSTPRIGDMTHPDGGSDADNHPHSGPAAFDLTKPFEAVRTLIRRYAEDTETPVAIDPATGAQIQQMVAWGMAAAILAEIAATTGRLLNEWFPAGDAPIDRLLAGLDLTIAQPGWSPAAEPALQAAKHVVADYVSHPRLPDFSIDKTTALGGTSEQQAIPDAGVLMCLEFLRSARRIRGLSAC